MKRGEEVGIVSVWIKGLVGSDPSISINQSCSSLTSRLVSWEHAVIAWPVNMFIGLNVNSSLGQSPARP
jgi:hypothetical protein